MSSKPDQIIISQLDIFTSVGVMPEERRDPQRLAISLVMEPLRGLNNLNDRIVNTVDYFDVTTQIKSLASKGARCLIETLADDIMKMLFARYPVAAAELEIRKFILPDTEYVAVKIRREAPQPQALVTEIKSAAAR